MKTGLVLEGGAMQGLYTAGVLDIFLENNIHFDGVMGVSAGALFGINYITGQKGRAIRYCKKYNKDRNYMGLLPFLKNGDIIDREYAYELVPRKLDPIDDEAFKKSDIPFYCVVTNMNTGEAEYIKINSVYDQMDELRASGSMPYVCKPVKIGNDLYMDGAVADSIPFEKMLEMGYDRLVVILTKSIEYVKKPLPQRLSKFLYEKNFPLFDEKVRNRHIMYNAEKERLFNMAAKGDRVEIILPSEPLYVGKIEKNPDKMDAIYQLGRIDGRKALKDLPFISEQL